MNTSKPHILNIFIASTLLLGSSTLVLAKATDIKWSISIKWLDQFNHQINLNLDTYQMLTVVSNDPIQTLFILPEPYLSPFCSCDEVCEINGSDDQLSFGINATLILINDCFPNNGTSVTVKVTDIDMVNRSGDIFLGFFIIVIISICLIPYCARRCGYGCGGWCKFRCKCKCNSILKSIKTSCCENCLTRRALQWKEDWKMRRSQQLASNVQSNMQYGDNFYNEL